MNDKARFIKKRKHARDKAMQALYQWQLSREDLDWIREINRFSPRPDLAVLLDILPEYSLQRLRRKTTIFEDVANLRRVRNIYMQLVGAGELVSVDADRPRRIVQEELLSMVKALIEAS